jgi:hypothetical protein
MKAMRVALLCVVIFLHGFLQGKSFEGRFRVLIVADTLDCNIGNTCVSDVYRLKKSLQTIAAQAEMPLDLSILDGKKCCGHDLRRWLHHQHTSAEDVVLLYYSGHGDKDPSGGPWPTLKLRDSYTRSALLLDSIRSIPCRFSMVIFDCCNGDGDEPQPRSAQDHYIPIIKNNRSWIGFKPLFHGFSGFIAVCAATRYESAGCAGYSSDKIWGGFLTTGLLKALKEFGENPNVTWEQILCKTKKYAEWKYNNNQHPIFTIERR